MRFRTYLLLLTAVVLLPGFLAAGVGVQKVRDAERHAILEGLKETVRATALLVDGQVLRSLGTLAVLAKSPSLQQRDLAAFYQEAQAADQKPDVWTLLLDDSGQQLLNTAVPFGAPLPPAAAADRVAQVIASGQPLITDVFRGPATGKLLTTIYVRGPQTPTGTYVVAQAFSLAHWNKAALQAARQHPEFVIGVMDRAGKFISRSQRADELVGQSARQELVSAAAADRDGLIRHRTLEGRDVYDAFTHSNLTGWTIAVAQPAEMVESAAAQATFWLASGMTAALAIAVLGAAMISGLLNRSMQTAILGVRELGRGMAPQLRRTSLSEVNHLNEALAQAGELLTAETRARVVAEEERARLLADEKARREAAQSENEAKDRFLALLGHELRNPLAAISSATQLLARKNVDAQKHERWVEIVDRQNKHLKQIVDDLLDVSRMLTGKLVLNTARINLARCVASCVDALTTTDSLRGHALSLTVADAWIEGDAVRIEQIVNNLVLNAAKFSEAGSEIRVRVATHELLAVVEVADAGAGIDRNLLDRMFEPFVQGEGLKGRQASGLGIGLALVKQLVTLHGGSIAASSAGPGMGSSFVAKFPLAGTAGPLPANAPAEAESAGSRRVLLVEDNIDVRVTTADWLRELGYQVHEAGSGEEALRALPHGSFALVVMDLGLPGISGYETAQRIRALDDFHALPMIALSGFGRSQDRTAALAAGFDQHLAKPVTADVLQGAMRTLLDDKP